MTVKRRCGLALVLLLSASGRLEAQRPVRVEGTVLGPDEIPIRGAYVLIEQSRFTAVTDVKGHFAIEGPEIGFTGTISVTYPEYRQERRKITLTEPLTTLSFTLQPRIKPPPIVAPDIPFVAADATSRVALTPNEAATLPSFDQKDALRAMQLLPGVTDLETTSALPVRGGTPGETLTRLDGITLYDADHAFGYMSALDMNAVERVQVAPGPLDARTAGRLSGATEIIGRSGDLKRVGGNASVNLLDAAGLIEVPFGGKGSALGSARRTYKTPLAKWTLSLIDGEGGPKTDPTVDTQSIFGSMSSEAKSEFFDLHGKVLFQPKEGSRTSLTIYRGREDLDISRDTKLPLDVTDIFNALGITHPDAFSITEPGHTLQRGASAGWSQVWSNRVQTEFSIAQTKFERNRSRVSTISGVANTLGESNTTEERAGRGTVSLMLPSGNTVDVGGEIAQHDISYSFSNVWGTSDTLDFSADLRDPNTTFRRVDSGRLDSFFVQHRLAIQNRVSLMPGIRLVRFDRTNAWYQEPHISGRAYFNERVSAHGAWSRAAQFVLQLERDDLLRGNGRFWTLADGTSVPVPIADEFSGGVTVASPAVLVDVVGFRKEYTDLTRFTPAVVRGISLVRPANVLPHGTDLAYGLEAMVQHRLGPNTAWASYTNARLEQTFPAISSVPFQPDQYREMEVKGADVVKFGAFTLGGVFTWSTGRPYTAILHTSTVTQPPTPEGEDTPPPLVHERTVVILPRNSTTFPNHHRLDVSFTRGFRIADRASMIGASVINLYNRANPWYKEFTSVQGEIIETDILMMARTFNVFFTIKF